MRSWTHFAWNNRTAEVMMGEGSRREQPIACLQMPKEYRWKCVLQTGSKTGEIMAQTNDPVMAMRNWSSIQWLLPKKATWSAEWSQHERDRDSDWEAHHSDIECNYDMHMYFKVDTNLNWTAWFCVISAAVLDSAVGCIIMVHAPHYLVPCMLIE